MKDGLSIRLPKSKAGRTVLGSGLVAGGVFGFLPILGFWMIPLGLWVLAHDFAIARRLRRKLIVRYERWRRGEQEASRHLL